MVHLEAHVVDLGVNLRLRRPARQVARQVVQDPTRQDRQKGDDDYSRPRPKVTRHRLLVFRRLPTKSHQRLRH